MNVQNWKMALVGAGVAEAEAEMVQLAEAEAEMGQLVEVEAEMV
jgi:hypothetical protein